eukprot:SAG22_NODE_2792_length_2208_cov_4.311048_2_plen_47_part_00
MLATTAYGCWDQHALSKEKKEMFSIITVLAIPRHEYADAGAGTQPP